MFNVGMAVRSSGRRRGVALVSIAVFAISMSLAIPGMVSSAGANIANPGNVGVSVNLSLLTPTFTLSGISTTSPATATMASNGALFIPRADLVFAPLAVHIALPNPELGDITVQVVASSDFVGAVNPSTRVEWLAGSLEMQWSHTGTMTACPIGPFQVHVTTKSAGSRPYSDGGMATMVDANLAIGAVGPGTPGCAGLESSVNATLSLPITATTTTSDNSTTSTTTTTVPTSTTVLTDLVPDTPIPAVVLSTTLTPAPRSPATRPATTTTQATPPHPAATTTTFRPPPKNLVPLPKPAHPKKHPVRHIRARKHRLASKHHKHRHRNHHRKHHRKHAKHRQTRPKPRPIGVRTVAPGPSATTPVAPEPRRFLLGGGFSRRRPVPPSAHVGTSIDPSLASSRHRASPSGLNYLAMLLLLVSGVYAGKLLRPDFNQIMRARKRPRRRLYGIDPLPPNDATRGTSSSA